MFRVRGARRFGRGLRRWGYDVGALDNEVFMERTAGWVDCGSLWVAFAEGKAEGAGGEEVEVRLSYICDC
jgi:hypothetical protein